MNCPNCSSPTRPGATFCGECGFRLSGVVAPAAATLLPPPPPPPGTLAPPPPAGGPPPPPPVATAEVSAVFASAPPPPPPIAPPTPPTAPRHSEETLAPPPEFEVPAPEVVAGASASNPFLISGPPGSIAPPPPPPPAPQQINTPHEQVIDEATRVSTRRQASGVWHLVLPDDSRHPVVTQVLVGRGAAPDARWPGASLLSVDDSTSSVSKTHAVFEKDADGLWVSDLQSRNGIFVEQPDGSEIDVPASQRTRVDAGADVVLGDFVIHIERQ